MADRDPLPKQGEPTIGTSGESGPENAEQGRLNRAEASEALAQASEATLIGENASPTDTQEEEEIRELLRGALADDAQTVPDVLSGVQRKLRQRSQGKFYADGWSTSRQAPIQTYLITSLVMLAFTLVTYAILRPLSGAAKVAEPPAPVQLVAPSVLSSSQP
jgi:hypothetical protein